LVIGKVGSFDDFPSTYLVILTCYIIDLDGVTQIANVFDFKIIPASAKEFNVQV